MRLFPAILAFLLFPAIPVNSQPIVIQQFGGLNDSVDSSVIPPHQAQDLLNVELDKTGLNLKKRDGYSSFLTLPQTNQQVSGTFAFKNNNAQDVLLAINGGQLYRSINEGTATNIATRTVTSTLRCVSADGKGYCLTSAKDVPFRDDGTNFLNLVANSFPAGSAIAATPDRIVISGVPSAPNRLYFSQSGSIENFVTGNTEISAWTEDVGLSGSSVTALSYLNGRLIVFKDYTVLGADCPHQFDCSIYSISDSVGTQSQENIINTNGLLYFRGSDNRFYAIDGGPGSITPISVDISSTTALLYSGKSRSNNQTSRLDFEAGTLDAAGPQSLISATITDGSIQPSSITFQDTSSSDFGNGSTVQLSTKTSGQLSLSIASGSFANGGAQNATATCENANLSSSDWPIQKSSDSGSSSKYWGAGSCFNRSTLTGPIDSIPAVRDIRGPCVNWAGQTPSCALSIPKISVEDPNTGSVIISTQANAGGGTSFTSSLDLRSYSHENIRLKLSYLNGDGTETYYMYSKTFTKPDVLPFSLTRATSDYDGASCPVVPKTPAGNCSFGYAGGFDFSDGSIYYSTGSYTSKIFDTTFSTVVGGAFSVDQTTTPAAAITYQIQDSSDGVSFGSFSSITPQDKMGKTRRYLRYKANFNANASSHTGVLLGVDMSAATTGQYVTQCIQPGADITAFGTIEAAGSFSCGGVAFYSSTGTACSSVGNTWTAQSTGAAVSAGLGSALKIRADFGLNSATCTARIDSITTNWVNGSLSSPTWGAYWNDGLYWAVQDAAPVNNKILKYDLISRQWFRFDIGANSLLSFGNNLYFGGTQNSKLYKFSNLAKHLAPTSDDGAAINAYWKSKDFSGGNPFEESEWNAISAIIKKQSGGSATMDWQINGGDTASGSYTIAMSTGINAVRHNERLPFGQRGAFMNIKFGNNSTIPFELLGVRIDRKILPWRPLP